MSRARTPRLRLTAAVAVAVAATASGVLAAPATAAPAAGSPVTAAQAASQDVAQDVAPFPKGSTLVSAGKTGFLTKAPTGDAPYSWTAYDGTVTPLDGGRYFGSAGTDTVVRDGGDGTYTLRDMGSGAEPVVITTPGTLLGVVDSVLVMQDGQEIRLVSKAGDEVVRRAVTGLPDGTRHFGSTAPGAFTVTVYARTSAQLSLVDVATASVTRTVGARNPLLGFDSVAGSPTHMTWYDYTPSDDGGSFHVLDLKTNEVKVMDEIGAGRSVALSEDWLAVEGGAYGEAARPLVLQSLSHGRKTKILDTVRSVRTGAGGAFLVDGILDRVEGVYRVTVGTDGEPAAELVARGERLPDLAVTHGTMPSVVDFPADVDHWATMSWDFNHSVRPKLTLTHKATGRQRSLSYSTHTPPPTYRFSWDSYGDLAGVGDYSGEYTWKLTATETLHVGPTLEQTGTLTLKRPRWTATTTRTATRTSWSATAPACCPRTRPSRCATSRTGRASS
ncbi:hypothetical protein [Streptomyces sp. NPDC014656]|uniref:hypothetical protein n=1 Tax=Streptomyces sp. NPDC014656 TaxID=3364878 RepID=UPI0037010952